MRRLLLLFVALAFVTVAGPAPASAAPPLRAVLEFPDVPIPLGGLSAACGFPVVLTFEGTRTVHVVLFLADDGEPTREIDTAPGTKATLTSPSASLSSPLAAIHTTYEGEVEVGNPATVTLTGFSWGGIGPLAAGRLVIAAVVVGFDMGIPVVAPVGPVLFVAGRSTTTADLCAALG